MRFANKVVVVTGGATGIGRAAAEAFAAEGAAVAIGDVNAAKAKEAVNLIQRQGGTALFVEADVSKDDQARRLADDAASALGGIDVLFNNVGIQTYGTVWETPGRCLGSYALGEPQELLLWFRGTAYHI